MSRNDQVVTVDDIRVFRETMARWIDGALTTETNYDEFFEHSLAHYHASVALGVRRARRGGSKRKSTKWVSDRIRALAAKEQG